MGILFERFALKRKYRLIETFAGIYFCTRSVLLFPLEIIRKREEQRHNLLLRWLAFARTYSAFFFFLFCCILYNYIISFEHAHCIKKEDYNASPFSELIIDNKFIFPNQSNQCLLCTISVIADGMKKEKKYTRF